MLSSKFDWLFGNPLFFPIEKPKLHDLTLLSNGSRSTQSHHLNEL